MSFLIQVVQARHIPNGRTSVYLPTCKASDGVWRTAVPLTPWRSRFCFPSASELTAVVGEAPWQCTHHNATGRLSLPV